MAKDEIYDVPAAEVKPQAQSEAETKTAESPAATEAPASEPASVTTTEALATTSDAVTDNPVVSVEEQERREAVAGSDRKIAAWREFADHLPELETKEQRMKRERREKSKKIIAAVSDGIGALSNLYFTSQYAPNMYNHEKSSMANAVDARIEKLKAEREKARDAHLKYALAMGDAENERAKTVRELEAAQEARRQAREKAEQEKEMYPIVKGIKEAQQRKEKNLADKAGHEATAARAEAEYAPQRQQAELDVKHSQKKSYDASAASSYAQANKNNVVHHFNGKTYHGDTKDYEKEVKEAAIDYNKRHQGEDGFEPIMFYHEERTANGPKRVTHTAQEIAAEVETRLAEENKGAGYGNKGAGYGDKNGKGAGYGN